MARCLRWLTSRDRLFWALTFVGCALFAVIVAWKIDRPYRDYRAWSEGFHVAAKYAFCIFDRAGHFTLSAEGSQRLFDARAQQLEWKTCEELAAIERGA